MPKTREAKADLSNKGNSNGASITISETARRGQGSTRSVRSKGRQRFLDFNISTASNNSGTQQFGAGQSLDARAARGSRDQSQGHARAVSKGVSRSLANHSGNTYFVNQQPITGGGAPSVMIPFREPFGDFVGSTTFAIEAFAVNPGLDTLLPVHSNVARMYERYRFESLRLVYEPIVTGASPDGMKGTIALGATMDASEVAPSDIEECLAAVPSVSGMPAQTISLDIKRYIRGPRDQLWYVRSERNPAGTDIKQYDPCDIWIAADGCSSAVIVGRLFLEGVLKLMNIRTDPRPDLPICNTASLAFINSFVPSGANTTAWKDFNALSFNGLGLDVNAGLLVIGPGRYHCSLTYLGTWLSGNRDSIEMVTALSTYNGWLNGIANIGLLAPNFFPQSYTYRPDHGAVSGDAFDTWSEESISDFEVLPGTTLSVKPLYHLVTGGNYSNLRLGFRLMIFSF